MEVLSLLKNFKIALQAIGPWGIVFFIWWAGARDNQRWKEQFAAERRRWEDRHQEEEMKWQTRHTEVVRMYENNVELLKITQSLAQNSQDLVIFNTQAMDKVYNISKNNLFCPIVRKNTQQKEIDG